MVKSIAKWWLAAFSFVIVSFIIVEFLNIASTSYQLHNIARISIKKSCDLFSQETYKRDDAQTIITPNVRGLNGVTVSGSFYGGLDEKEAIYNNLYQSTSFSQFMGRFGSEYRALNAMYKGMTSYDPDDLESAAGKFYAESLVTPINMGVTYLDEKVIHDMFKWHITTFLVGGSYDEGTHLYNLLTDDGDGRGPYVFYKGYRVYLDDFAGFQVKIKDYHVFDTTTQKDAFKKYTNMDADTLNHRRLDSDASFSSDWVDERNKICVAELTYQLPMDYTGVTPLKRVMKFFQKVPQSDDVRGSRYRGITNQWSWNDSEYLNTVQQFTGGGLDKDASDKKINGTTGRLTYFIVR